MPGLTEQLLLGRAHGLRLLKRSWGETESYEFLKGQEKVFSFQITTSRVEGTGAATDSRDRERLIKLSNPAMAPAIRE